MRNKLLASLLLSITFTSALAACGGADHDVDEASAALLELDPYCGEDEIATFFEDGVRCIRLPNPGGNEPEEPDQCAAQITCAPPAGSNATTCVAHTQINKKGKVTCVCSCI